jgi:hypothetical protein
MRTLAPLKRLARSGQTLAHLVVECYLNWLENTAHCWQGRSECGRLADRRRCLAWMTRYFYQELRNSLRQRGERFTGRGPAAVQRDLRRRRVTVLLNALGRTPEAITASITAHWYHASGDLIDQAEPYLPLEWYLATRLHHHGDITVGPWTCYVNGTTVATPAAVRGYLATRHESRLSLNPPGVEPATR